MFNEDYDDVQEKLTPPTAIMHTVVKFRKFEQRNGWQLTEDLRPQALINNHNDDKYDSSGDSEILGHAEFSFYLTIARAGILAALSLAWKCCNNYYCDRREVSLAPMSLKETLINAATCHDPYSKVKLVHTADTFTFLFEETPVLRLRQSYINMFNDRAFINSDSCPADSKDESNPYRIT